ncbi:MAG: tetratricopeptide repeat protein [Thermodesulfobacteriota bacterium]
MKTTRLLVSLLSAALVLCSISYAQTPGTTGDPFEQALKLHREGKVQEAVELYEKVLDKDMTHHGAMFGLGSAYYQMGRYPEATKALEDVLAFYPDDVAARTLLAEIQLTRGQLEDARKNFNEVLSVRPDFVAALVGLGKTEYFLGNRFAGEKYLKDALARDPNNPYLQQTVRMTEEANREYLREEEAERRQKLLQAFNEAVMQQGRIWSEQQARLQEQQALAQAMTPPQPVQPSIEYYTAYPWYPWYPWHRWPPRPRPPVVQPVTPVAPVFPTRPR